MAGSRDTLNAFNAHIDSLVAAGNIDAARRAWADFTDNVSPSFGERRQDEARLRRAEFDREHATPPDPYGGAATDRSVRSIA